MIFLSQCRNYKTAMLDSLGPKEIVSIEATTIKKVLAEINKMSNKKAPLRGLG